MTDVGTLPAPFWWLLFHLEMLILAPTATADRVGSIQETIQCRLGDILGGTKCARVKVGVAVMRVESDN